MLLLRRTADSPIPVEADCLAPDRLVGKSATEVARLPVLHGNAAAEVGDFFRVEGDPADATVLIEGDCSRVKRLGVDMKAGVITVRGNVGRHLGADMTGGEIVVHGNADDAAGAEMRGGRIRIAGNAGNLLGGAYRGAPVGMRGGVILVEGNAGHEIGVGIRRGTIAVGGSSGDYAGMGMLAGTILLFGAAGARPGAGMKRGTIAFFGGTPRLLPTFRPACVYDPVFLHVYLRRLIALGFPLPRRCLSGNFRRYTGDHVALGRGELLQWEATDGSPFTPPEY